MNSNNQKAVVSPYNSQKAACFLLIGFPAVRELRQPLSRKEAVFMLCEWCNKQLEDWQIKEGNKFCGKSCAGKYVASKRYPLSDSERFWGKVNKTDNCWVWTGGIDKDGYGNIKVNGKNLRAHRFSYKLHFGKIPKGKIICHHCDNRPCVNPDHLYLGNHKVNARDREERGKNRRGVNNPRAVLDPQKVRKIRSMYGNGHRIFELGKLFGVTSSCISDVVHNKRWKHVKG